MNDLDGYRELYTLSSQVPDWRSDLGRRHLLTDVLFIMVAALIAGAQNCEDIYYFARSGEAWFRQFLRLPHGIPHHDMYLRTLAAIRPEQFEVRCRRCRSKPLYFAAMPSYISSRISTFALIR